MAVCAWLVLAGACSSHADEPAALEVARIHVQKGRLEEAIEVYNALEAEGGDRIRIALGRSLAYEAMGNWKEAMASIATAAENAGDDADLPARLAELQFRQGLYKQALESAERALELAPKHLLARLVQADLYTETGRIREADEAYRWFVGFYNRSEVLEVDELILLARGVSQYARWNGATQIFKTVVNAICPEAIRNDPHRWQAHYISGSLLLEKYNRADAVPELQAALAINAGAVPVLLELADAAFQKRDLEAAGDFTARALKINPHSVQALQFQADLELAAGRTAEAADTLNRALSINPHEQRTLARLAACYLLEDGFPVGIEVVRLLKQPEADHQANSQTSSRFVRLLSELAKRNPRPGDFLTVLAEKLEDRFQFEAAETLYLAAIDVMPELSSPQTSLGLLYMRTGRTAEAEPILDAAFKADPYHVRISNMRKVLKVLKGYRTIETEHFRIRVDARADGLLGEYMARYLEEIYNELTKEFGFRPAERTTLEVYSDAKGLSGHQWFSARMIGLPWIQTVGATTGKVIALTSPSSGRRPYNWARVLRHELVHVITLQQTEFRIPHWFTEALAVRSEGYPRPPLWNRLLLERVPKGELRTLNDLSDAFSRPKSSDDWQFAYCQSLLYAEYMIDVYGLECLSKLLSAYRSNLPTSKAIEHACGVSLSEFEEGYLRYLNEEVARLRGGQTPEARPLADLEAAYLEDKSDTKAAAAYARGLLRDGRRRRAREIARAVLSTNTREPDAALVMAILALRSEDVIGAIRYLERAIDRENPHRGVLKALAQLKYRNARVTEAAALYEIGREKFPDDLEIVRRLAAAYLKLAQPVKLVRTLKDLARMDADQADVRRTLARLALEAGNDAEAIQFGEMALHVDVNDVETHRTLAAAYLSAGKRERAVIEYQAVLKIKPDDIKSSLRLAEALLELQQHPEAKQVLESLIKRAPRNARARELLKKVP
jgi:tetratricopeptide (TPR) repeat protein